jgi:Molecular chaperone
MSNTIDFGIDLGTTNSAIAKFIKGKVEVFKNPTTWKDTTASVVGFRKDSILVGERARTYQEKDPKNVVGQFKRKMGTTESFRIKSSGESITPVELSSIILKELKSFVQTGEKVESAIITIPASFDGIQSNSTKEAAKEAGFKQVVLLQEPIAASLAYANQTKNEDLTDGKWLVYDLGGGTFDVALVKISDGEMKILDHEGDNFLGGSDFDRAIVEHIIVPYLNENYAEVDMQNDLQSGSGRYNALFYKLLHKAEQAKIELSGKPSAEIEFEFEDEEVFINITKTEFENLLREPIDRTTQIIKTILTRNGMTSKDIDFVLMVGGSTYIPYVRNRVGELLQVPVKTDIDPTTAVAVGAAFYAGTKERKIGDESQNGQNYDISIRAVYEKATKEDVELFAARVEGNLQGLSYRIRRTDGGFETGIRQLTERISEDLPLVKDSYNYFVFTVLDSSGNEVPTNLKEFQIAHNIYTVYGQPLPEDICLELDDIENKTTYLKTVFSKNSILPLKSPTITQTVTRTITKDSGEDCLYINVYEGLSSNIPEANKNIGILRIPGNKLEKNLIKGSEIEIVLEMSESRDLSVSAYIPYTDQTFKEIFSPKKREVPVHWLNQEIESLETKILNELEAAQEREDDELAQELNTFTKELYRLQDKVEKLAEDDETDVKFQLDGEKMRLAQQVDAALQERRAIFLLEAYREIKSRCQNLIDEDGMQRYQRHLDEITFDEESYTNPPSAQRLKSKIGEIENLYHSILWHQPRFLSHVFNDIVEKEKNFSDEVQARRLIESGQIATIDGNYEKLREIIFQLFDLLPTERRSSYEGKTGIG